MVWNDLDGHMEGKAFWVQSTGRSDETEGPLVGAGSRADGPRGDRAHFRKKDENKYDPQLREHRGEKSPP